MLGLEFVLEDNIGFNGFLFPEERHAASQRHVREHEIMADEYFLGLHEVGHIVVLVESPMVEPCSGHFFRPAADHAVIVGEVLVLAVDFSYMSLDDPGVPTVVQFVLIKQLQHVLVPPEFFLSGALVEVSGSG